MAQATIFFFLVLLNLLFLLSLAETSADGIVPSLRRDLEELSVPSSMWTCPDTTLFKKDELYEKFTLGRSFEPWHPRKDRFMFVHCVVGQATNRLLCIQKLFFYAGLTNRIAVYSDKVEEWEDNYNEKYQINALLDRQLARDCLGQHTILTTDEYFEKYGKKFEVDEIRCWRAWGCPVQKQEDKLYIPYLHSVEFAPNLTKTLFEKPFFILPDEFFKMFTPSDAERVMINDPLGTMLWDCYTTDFQIIPFLRSPTCPFGTPIMPARSIRQVADEITKEMFGEELYMSLHFRRGDFPSFCERIMKNENCMLSTEKAATCITHKLKGSGIHKLLLLSNADQEEIEKLEGIIREQYQEDIEFVALQDLGPEKKPTIEAEGLEVDYLVNLLVQKLVAARGTIFLGTQYSSFSNDIMRYRYAYGASNCNDDMMCVNDS
eukprot:TRINITY_DN2874_c0_g2_i1.p1 TRINITY_DN2874_c0_g2~~TRINITY_DN2874_c0_g2_i1.p1  ORF type:complete len:433 (+),score=93.37 TRINITY_DN2874_c0_g2_i1:231-1529(+)